MLGEDFGEVLAAAKGGDQAAFTRIWRETQPALLRFLRVREPGLAEDVATEAWLVAIGRLGDFSGDEAGFRAWLATIARNKLVDHHRRAARRPERLTEAFEPYDADVPAAPDAADVAAERASTEQALRLIATLPPDVAEMVALRVVVGLDVADVAQVVGRKPGTVRVAVHRGLRKLAAVLAEQQAGEKSAQQTVTPAKRRVTPATATTFQDRDA